MENRAHPCRTGSSALLRVFAPFCSSTTSPYRLGHAASERLESFVVIMGGSDSTSPLITVGLILAVPLLNRYLRSNQAPTSTTSASPSSLRRPWYSPRLFSLRMSRLVSLHPSEYLLLALFVTLATYHLAALNPLGQSYRASRDLFLHTGLPIGASSASLRGRVAALGVEEVGLSGWMNTGEIGGMGEDGGMESAAGAAAGGDVLERLLRRLNSMSSRVSVAIPECYS